MVKKLVLIFAANNLDLINEDFAILLDIILNNYQASSIREAIINLIDKQHYLEERGLPLT